MVKFLAALVNEPTPPANVLVPFVNEFTSLGNTVATVVNRADATRSNALAFLVNSLTACPWLTHE